MALNQQDKRRLRSLGHGLKPVVIVGGAGVTDAVVRELDGALAHHELLKVRVNAGSRPERGRMIATLCERTDAALVQSIGHVALLYRANPDKPRISLND